MKRDDALAALQELIGQHAADHSPTEHNTNREAMKCIQCQRLYNAEEALRTMAKLTSNKLKKG